METKQEIAAADAVNTAAPETAAKPSFWKTVKNIFTTKKGLIGLAVVAVAGVLAWVGFTQFKRPDVYQLALDNVAEARFYMKAASDSNSVGTVQLYSGVREETYERNGIATPSKAFTVVSVEPKDNTLISGGVINAEVTIDGGTPEVIKLERNPYGTNYAADLGKAVESTSAVTVAFKNGTETIATVELTNKMPEGAIGWETALEIAAKEMDDKINNGGRIESYTKILCDNTTTNSPYWFVSFATESGESFFVVIAPDGKIIGTSEKKANA